VIGLDTSVVVRYLVGSPHAEAAEAAALIDGDDECGISLVALAEAAHVLRTQYEVEQRDVIDLAHHATLDCPPTEHRGITSMQHTSCCYDVSMRTTVTLEPDLAARVRSVAR